MLLHSKLKLNGSLTWNKSSFLNLRNYITIFSENCYNFYLLVIDQSLYKSVFWQDCTYPNQLCTSDYMSHKCFKVTGEISKKILRNVYQKNQYYVRPFSFSVSFMKTSFIKLMFVWPEGSWPYFASNIEQIWVNCLSNLKVFPISHDIIRKS